MLSLSMVARRKCSVRSWDLRPEPAMMARRWPSLHNLLGRLSPARVLRHLGLGEAPSLLGLFGPLGSLVLLLLFRIHRCSDGCARANRLDD